VVNSPGGFPVQSTLIAKRIRDLAQERQVPVLAFCEDVAASGGYWLACAADEIFAQESSVIGSIGVISSGFGFQEAIAKLGIERRLYTAGEKKSLLDPFQPEKPEDVKRLEALQSDIHASFMDLVRSRRGKRLKGDEKDVFSGAFWTGRRALELGLVDGIGDLRTVLRDRFGDKVRVTATAEIAGYDRSHKPKDFTFMAGVVRELYPDGADHDRAEMWAGLRPMTPTNLPFIGRRKHRNLYYDTGHGHIGWTMSHGSARILADAIAGRRPALELASINDS